MSAVGLFSLSADMLKLKCDCGQSEMTIVYSKDGKIRLTVPCIFCPKPHSYVVNSSIFFGKDLFVLPCAYSDMNIAMMGDVNQVKAELARTELELIEMLEESGIDSLEALRQAEADADYSLTDPQIFDIIMFVINDLDAEGKIYCKCENEGEGDFEVEMLPDGIKVSCKKCGAMRVIPTDGLLAANAFLNADSLYLE
jgi:ribosomal protein S27E